MSNTTWVFLPGWNFRASIWRDVAKKMKIDKYLLIDLPKYEDNIDTIVEALNKKIPKNANLMAWSLGGLLAIYLAYKYPRHIQRLILVATNPKFVADAGWEGLDLRLTQTFINKASKNFSKITKKFLYLIQYPNNSLSNDLNINMHIDYRNDAEKLQYLQLLFTLDLREQYSALCIPIYNIMGANDVIVPSTLSKRLEALNANSISYVIPSTNHIFFLDKTSAFLRQLQPIIRHCHTHKVKRAFNKAINTYEKEAELQTMIGIELIEMIKHLYPNNLVDLGCGTGTVTHLLAKCFRYKNFYAIDIADKFILQAKKKLLSHGIKVFEYDFEVFFPNPLRFDLIFSNMALQWSYCFKNTLFNLYNSLAHKGSLAFSIPLQGTFKELTMCEKNLFNDLEVVRGYLRELNISHVEYKKKTYVKHFSSPLSALKSIKAVGANCVINTNRKTLHGKSFLQQLQSVNLIKNFTLTYEIGHFVIRKQ